METETLPSSPQNRTNVASKVRMLGVIVIAICILYTGLWFWGTDWAKAFLREQLGLLAQKGTQIECNDLDLRGFPFRVGLFCASLQASFPEQDLRIEGGEIRSAAQIYNPGHAIVEMDGPLNVQNNLGLDLTATWDLAHASVVAGLDGLKRSSMTVDQFNVTAALPDNTGDAALALAHGELHMRSVASDVDLAASLDQTRLNLSTLPVNVPEFQLSADLTLFNQAVHIARGFGPQLRGEKGTLRRFSLDFGSVGRMALSGDFSVSDVGLLSGEFELSVTEIAGLQKAIVASFPQAETAIDSIAALLQGLSQDGKTTVVKISVQDGKAGLGFLPIGEIPPL